MVKKRRGKYVLFGVGERDVEGGVMRNSGSDPVRKRPRWQSVCLSGEFDRIVAFFLRALFFAVRATIQDVTS